MVNGVSTLPVPKPNFFMISAPKQIVPENEAHKSQHQKEAGPVPHFHHPLRYRTSENGFDGVEQEMAAVEWGNRQKVQNSDPD
jgi:hypothetical protein